MPDKEQFNRLRQLLSGGASSDECLFYDCNDNIIIIGSTKIQTFNMPLRRKYIYKLALVYVQDGNIILRKTLDDLTAAEFDDSLLYFTLSETESMKFHEGRVEAQLKVLLEDGTILCSDILKINAVKTIDDMYFNYNNGIIESLQATVKGQKIDVVQFFDIAADSDKTHICKFIFDSSWDKLNKKAVFKDEYNNYIDDVEIDKNNQCVIPNVIIGQPGNIYIGVVGTLANVNRPTEWSNSIRVLNSCTYSSFKSASHEGSGGQDVPYADDTVAGIMKLYGELGNNTDGTITQKTITDTFNSMARSIKLRGEEFEEEGVEIIPYFDI